MLMVHVYYISLRLGEGEMKIYKRSWQAVPFLCPSCSHVPLWLTLLRETLGGTQYRKKKWQIPKYRVENRLNTDTAYVNHIYNRFRILMVASI